MLSIACADSCTIRNGQSSAQALAQLKPCIACRPRSPQAKKVFCSFCLSYALQPLQPPPPPGSSCSACASLAVHRLWGISLLLLLAPAYLGSTVLQSFTRSTLAAFQTLSTKDDFSPLWGSVKTASSCLRSTTCSGHRELCDMLHH